MQKENARHGPPLMISPMNRKVLIVHRLALIRFALSTLIGASTRFVVCAQTDSVTEARELFDRHRPQLVVLGLTLRSGDGIGLMKDFHKSDPAVRCVVFTLREDDDSLSIQRAFRAGANGYLVVEDSMDDILVALEQALDGELRASDKVYRALLKSLAEGEIQPISSELRILSDRELQVFSLIGRGFGASQLASELHLSVKTIETYQMHLKEKLGLHSAIELSEKAARWMRNSARRNLQLKKQLVSSNGHTSA